MHRMESVPVGSFCGFPDLVSLRFETRSGYPKLLHFVDQRGPLEAEFSGGAFGAADYPADGFERAQNQYTFGIPQRGWRRRRS